MIFKQLFDRETSTYTYLLADAQSKDAIIIDSVVSQVQRDSQLIKELGLTLRYSLETHVHADHVTGSGALRELTGAKTVVAAAANVPCADLGVVDGESLRFGRHEIQVRSTPGHTSGCLTYVVVDGDQTMAFTGDALLIRGCGRTDFQQGNAHTLYRSVHKQIFSLPKDTILYPGHDYNGHTSSTVAEELAHNSRLHSGVTEAQFVQTMESLNLANPKQIDVAVPANMACGN